MSKPRSRIFQFGAGVKESARNMGIRRESIVKVRVAKILAKCEHMECSRC